MRRRVLALLALAAGPAIAEPRWYLQIDNDLVFGTDRWYSSGVRLGRLAEGSEWGVVQEVFTPEAKRWRPGVDDRAPNARLFAYHARHAAAPDALGTFEISLGVRGPSALGREATEAIHRLVPAPDVEWSREERDKVDAQVGVAQTRAVGALAFHYGAVVGDPHVFAHGGIEWRTGDARVPVAFSPVLRYSATPPPAAGASAWSGFVGASARAVARNAMIRRNYDPAGPELEPRRVVVRIAAGAALVQPWGSATFALVQETREFDAQRRAHGFGALAVHVDF